MFFMPLEHCPNVSLMCMAHGLLVLDAWCVFATDQARQILSGGGLYLNQIRVQSALETMDPTLHLLHGRFSVLRIGR